MPALACLLVVMAAYAAAQTPEKAEGKILGRIISSHMGEPLPGVQLTLTREWKEKQRVFTGFDGVFSFGELKPGGYQLGVVKSGYDIKMRNLPLAESDPPRKLEIKLRKLAVITGRVTGPDRRPVQGARIQGYRKSFESDRVTFNERRSTAETDDRGVYRLFDLEAGIYVVQVISPREPAMNGMIRYANTSLLYPNATQLAEAAELRLHWGQELSGVDFELPPAPDTGLVGLLTLGATGRPPPGGQVRLLQVDGQFVLELDRAPLNREGRFAFAGLVPGTYKVAAEPSVRAANHKSFGHADVEVRDSEVAEVQLVTEDPVTISGKVVFEDPPSEFKSQPQGPFGFQFYLEPDGPRIYTFYGRRRPQGASWETGEFTAEWFPAGSYRVSLTRPPEGGYLKSVVAGGRPLPEPEFTVQRGSPPPLEIRVAFDGGRVAGTVKRPGPLGGDAALPEGSVFVLPEAGQGGYAEKRSASFDAEGRFDITGVPPGSYIAFAAPREFDGDFNEPEFRRRFGSFGKSIRVKSGETLTLDLELLPGRQ